MERYLVSVTMDLNIEINANSPEEAAEVIARHFAITNSTDPLAEKRFTLDNADHDAVIKTAIVQEWEVSEIEVEKV